ncbi:MAG: chitobiase/beta-hexosaminidase C-terminal domain-containing protein, partial [Clostridia bacterium]|nr:chitobiase/beta-hexosaminidase C-terminal domain-containing protein [Clostridia bacterium]
GGTITNCYSVGHTVTTNSNIAGGIAGCTYGGTISNCYALNGSVSGYGTRWGGVVGDCQKDDNTSGGTVSNCYTDDTRVVSTQSGNATITDCALEEDTAFASGKVAYLLNGGKTDGTQSWYQNLSDDNNKDSYPVLNDTHGIVYSVCKCNGETPAGYSNVNENEPHTDENPVDNVCDVCGANLHTHEWTYTASNNTITAECGAADCPATGTNTIVISASGKTYDGTAVTATVTNNVDTTDYSSSIVYKNNDDVVVTEAVNAGTYTANLTLTNADSTEVTASVEFTIDEKAITVTADNKSKTYGEDDNELTYTITDGTLVNGETLTGTLVRAEGEDVGTYAITQGTLTNENNPNYDITFVEGTFTINGVDISAATAVQNGTLTYDGTEQTPTFIVTLGNTTLAADDYDVTVTAQTNAGDYTATIIFTGNYTGSIQNVEWSIQKAIPTVTAPTATSITYGQKLSESVLTEGWEWVTPDTTPPVNNTGFAAVKTLTDDNNYDYSQLEGYTYTADTHKLSVLVAVTVNKVGTEVTEAPTPIADLEYNGTAQSLINSGAATGGEMQYSLDGTNYSPIIPTGTDAKTYTVWYKVVGDENYNDTTPASIEVSIARKAVTVTADNASKTYGGNDTALTYTAEGLVNGDTLTGTLSRETGENVGTYVITQGTLTNENNPNYDITFVEGTFTINGVDISAATAVQNGTLTYDGTVQTPTFIVTLGNTTLADDDYDVTVTAQTNAGSYTAIITGKGNCTGTISNVTWSISRATPTAEMFAYTAPTDLDYDGNVKSATVTTDKDGMGAITVRYSGEPVAAGTYEVFIDVEASTNYNAVLNLLVGTFTINGIAPTYTAPTAVADLVYDGNEKALVTAGTATGGTMKYSLDGVNYINTIPTAANADTYSVYWMVEGDEPNYNDIICDEPISVTIAKAEPVLTTTPVAITGLGYTGEAQALITAGTTADGEIQYSTNNVTYTSTVPTGTAVGDYTVYYKIIGDSNHNDKIFDPITVSIGKGVAPAITEPTATAIEYGQTLSASALSDSAWSWENGTEIPTVMNSGYNAVMTVTDDNNYDYSTVMGYNALTHTITRTVMVNVTPATPTVVVNATPAADIAGKPISATAIVTNPNNASLFDTPTAELTYSINGVTQSFTGSFVIPEETSEGTVITIIATTMASGNYAAGYGTTTVTVTSCIHENKTLMSDADSHWYECLDCGADIDKTTHSGGTATCNSKASCGICNTVYGEFDSSNHAYNVSTAWTTENGYHWHECNGCGADLDKGVCTGGTATCMTAAICETCGIAHGDVDTNNHANNVSAAWSSDSEYHWHECACGADIDKTTHSGGTADCKNKAKCEACGKEHGTVDTSNHANNVSTAWSSDGTNHYHECACGAKVDTAQCSGGTATCMTAAICDVCRNEHGTTDISNHADVSPTWTSDGTNHWHECACGADLDKGACTGGTATCTNKAVCTTCQQAYGEINSNNHADKETVWSKDGTGHWHACGCGKLDFEVHTSSGEATEDTAETCIICGYVIAPATGHIKHTADTSKWLSDETNHWHKCVGCEEKMDTAAHTFGDWQTETEPTTTTEGKKIRTCSTCFYTDEEAIPVIGTVAAPVFSPASTSFNGSINVTITTATDGAIIYYTTDGSTPTTSSKKYTGTITVTSTTTIKAIAVKDGMADSKVSSVTYTKQESGGYVPTPNPTPTPTPTPTPITPDDDEPQIKGDNGKTGWDAILDAIKNASDGDTIVVDMNGTTELPKYITKEMKDRNIYLVLEMDNGFSWTINGLDVTNPKNVDMGVKKGTKNIPVDVINSITGESYTIQLSLEHNGDFGFTAVLTVDLGKKNNGLYANLFWYYEKGDELVIVDFDEIQNGKAELMFTHASDWAVVIDDEVLGTFDDVASGSGIEDNSEIFNFDSKNGSAPIVVAVSFATLAVISTAVVVYRKRRQK